jgi:DNA-binding LacI/PurR family transcriptional regulator
LATTVYDIAKAAGVNRRTVQRALLNKGRISPETKARIQKLAEEMHYRPNQAALTLTLGRSNLIGVVCFPTIFTPVQMVLEPITRGLHQEGYQMLFNTATGFAGDERLSLEQLLNNRVAGAITISGPSPENIDICRELVEDGVKLVVVDAMLEGLDVPQMLPDQYASSKLLTEYLISLGHSRIAHMAIPENSYTGRARGKGYRDAMAAAGIGVDPALVLETDFSETAGAQVMKKLLLMANLPTAVVARHDIVAMGAMDAILSAGLSIPGDISLVGTADMWFTHMLKVPLTTVSHPHVPMGEAAVRKLLAMLDGEYVEPGLQTIDVELVVRDSCGPPNPSGLRKHLQG